MTKCNARLMIELPDAGIVLNFWCDLGLSHDPTDHLCSFAEAGSDTRARSGSVRWRDGGQITQFQWPVKGEAVNGD